MVEHPVIMRIHPLIQIVALGFLINPQSSALPPAQEVAAALQKKYDAIRDFTADFVHESEGGNDRSR